MQPAKTARRHIRVILCLMTVLGMLAAGASVAHARRVAVSVEVANVRSGPGTQHEQIWQVEIYTPIEVIDTQNGWYFFEDFEGTRAWIHEDLVAEIDTVITKKG
jgi:SH3-like domain-containing protein